MSVYLNVARDFYKRPAARNIVDGEYSGELFRDILKQKIDEALSKNEKLEVDFSEVTMAGSSFLDEAFGGMVRQKKITADDFINLLIIKTKKDSWRVEILSYIRDAGKK